ncbi:hypothetical protein C8R46DRAFT_1207413 [Mycena filopes]|nr:hypothetical protein C8R46DRAFT_1207413 [Mycena filopes]
MGAFNHGFGVTLIATWLATLLAGFAKFSNDVLFKRALVGVVLFLVFLGLATECAEVYLDVVTHWGNPVALYTVPWPRLVSIPCNSLIAFIVDQFLIHRFYAVRVQTDNPLAMSFTIMQFFSSNIGQPITRADFRRVTPLSDVWSGIGVVTDVAIAACLVWTLRGMKTSFKDTAQLIHHIMAVSIQNGCTTSALLIGALIASNLAPTTKINFVFYYILGPMYLLTLLSNLTLRRSAPVSINQGWSSNKTLASHNSQVPFGGVHVDVRRSVTTTGGASTDLEAGYDDTTVRGTSDDVEAGRKEPEDPSSADQNAEKI